LEHSVQYAARGGIEPFLSEYLTKSLGQVIAKRSFSIHDYIDIENAAINKSNQVSKAVEDMGWTFHLYNNCQYPMTVAVDYMDDSGQWNTMGYWNIAGKTDTSLADSSNVIIHTNNALYYYYAESPDHNLLWAGDHNFTVQSDGRTLGFEQKKIDSILEAEQTFTCD
jgi:uncharacterized membrane protein